MPPTIAPLEQGEEFVVSATITPNIAGKDTITFKATSTQTSTLDPYIKVTIDVE